MLRLLTFGGLALARRDGSAPPRVRPQRLAILAVLASAGDRGISRERLSALFWPDSEDPRHSLRQALYALKQELGVEAIANNGVLSLDRNALSSDIAEFRSALATGDRVRAASLAEGPFLHDFTLSSAPEFERWADEERAAIGAEATKIILALAKESQAANDFETAADWWRRLTILDSLSGRFALGYLKALAASGDRAGALAFARAHERLVRRELEADPDPEIRRLESALRAIPSPPVVHTPAATIPSIPRSAPPDYVIDGSPVVEPVIAAPVRTRPHWQNLLIASGTTVALVALIAAVSNVRWRESANAASKEPTFAVGMIREEGVPDTLRIGGVLTDMLATNLARVAGLSVMANSRLFELMLPGQDTLPGGWSDAARRAGATDILQGRLLTGPQWTLAMEIQRVNLRTGLVTAGYRVAAPDRYALIDSMTSAIARTLKLGSPEGSVADATTDNPVAYRLYEEGLRAYNQYDAAAALRLMNAALQEDSTFAMAAYYAAISAGSDVGNRARALRLAVRAPERERLMISADLRAEDMDPGAVAIADSLATKYPLDPRGHEFLWKTLWFRGDWAESVKAIDRAIAIDSASEPVGRQGCRLCSDLQNLAETYFWWDSIPAAERTAQRMLRLRPNWYMGFNILIRTAAARGDSTRAQSYYRSYREANPLPVGPLELVEYDIRLENYDRAESTLQSYLDSPRPSENADARWYETIILRNQGRIDEAIRLANRYPAPQDMNLATAALEEGRADLALPKLRARESADISIVAPTSQARLRAWNNTLVGMALVAAGDTAQVRKLANTVEYWGRHSLYGRDQRAHHYLRGMLLVAQGKDNEAVSHLRAAIHSPTNGFTRVNLELGRALLRLKRPAEAVAVLRAALHGGVDGSNLYVTRTDLHEALAQAFTQMGNRDSATYHYRAVANAWKRADPSYRSRRDAALAFLSSTAPRP